MNLRSRDPNLLVVFDALMGKRNVTYAAQSIGLSQPASSNALSRLRRPLDDELFIEKSGGMQPAPWALQHDGQISTPLGDIENTITGAAFDPATSKRTFTISALEYGIFILVPPLLRRVKKGAARARRANTCAQHDHRRLDTQRADLALFS